MKQKWFMAALLIVSVLTPARAYFTLPDSGIVETSFGVGANYHLALNQLEGTDFDDDHLSYLAGIKLRFNHMWTIDASVEYYPSEEEISYIASPRLSFLYGEWLYVGTGVEKKYVDLESGEDDWEDETYFLQAGLEIPLSANNALNIDAYYGLDDFSDISDVVSDFDNDNLTFGIRFYHYF